MATDAFDTPPSLAKSLVRVGSKDAPAVVADFAAGTGELLLAAAALWPTATYVASDLDEERVRHLRTERPDWIVRRLDFTSPDASEVLFEWEGAVDLVLLNPPFSCRGGRRYEIETSDGYVSCSLAMAFVLLSLPFLAEGGEVLAILPKGCVDSDKDAQAREYLSRTTGFRVIQEHGRGTFPGCTPSTVVAQIGGSAVSVPPAQTARTPAQPIKEAPLRIYRGRLPRHEASTRTVGASSTGFAYVHTTDLMRGGVSPDADRIVVEAENEGRLAVGGPAILVPRVGRPYLEKVALHTTAERVVLSDCVVALLCTSAREARSLHATLRAQWDIVQGAYGGTCARYTTLRKLQRVLHNLGYPSEIVRKGENPRNEQTVADKSETTFESEVERSGAATRQSSVHAVVCT